MTKRAVSFQQADQQIEGCIPIASRVYLPLGSGALLPYLFARGVSKKRRSFLKSAAALLPAAGFNPMSIAEAQVQGQEHVISAGQDRLGEAHSRGYSSILFKVFPRETSNGLFVLEHMNLVSGGPPLHMHPHQEDFFLPDIRRSAVCVGRSTIGAEGR